MNDVSPLFISIVTFFFLLGPNISEYLLPNHSGLSPRVQRVHLYVLLCITAHSCLANPQACCLVTPIPEGCRALLGHGHLEFANGGDCARLPEDGMAVLQRGEVSRASLHTDHLGSKSLNSRCPHPVLQSLGRPCGKLIEKRMAGFLSLCGPVKNANGCREEMKTKHRMRQKS